jgi:hypothetical protein
MKRVDAALNASLLQFFRSINPFFVGGGNGGKQFSIAQNIRSSNYL